MKWGQEEHLFGNLHYCMDYMAVGHAVMAHGWDLIKKVMVLRFTMKHQKRLNPVLGDRRMRSAFRHAKKAISFYLSPSPPPNPPAKLPLQTLPKQPFFYRYFTFLTLNGFPLPPQAFSSLSPLHSNSQNPISPLPSTCLQIITFSILWSHLLFFAPSSTSFFFFFFLSKEGFHFC